MKNKLLALILSTILVMSLMLVAAPAVSAAYGETINLAGVKANQRGDGYFWDNMKSVLTLDGFELSTSEDFGLKLPAGATVELVGTNKISGGLYGLGCPGSVTFTGSGSLTVEGGKYAIYSYTDNTNHKLRFDGGKITLKGGTSALFSEKASVSITASTLTLSADNGYALDARAITATGGKLTSNATLHSTHEISLSGIELEVSGKSGTALVSDNLLKLENVKILAGSDSSSLSSVEAYNGESFLQTVPVSEGARDSILFGEGTPITVDYLLLASAVVLIGCALVLPIIHRKNKVKKMYASLNEGK